MREFTFIVVTYNHEKYLKEHLESIKYIVENFGTNMDIDLVVADDKSKDNTIEVANVWIEQNRELFRDTLIIQRDKNVGTVRNIKSAIDATKTAQFKFLAGDDKYCRENIFEIQKEGKMVLTPLVPFGQPGSDDIERLKVSYKLLLNNNSRPGLAKLLEYACVIPAPGVFLDSNYYRMEGLWDFLEQFHLIEDYPTWYFMFHNADATFDVEVLTKPYIYYRVGSGISTANKGSGITQEERNVMTKLDVKTSKYPKYINVYKYIYHVMRFIASRKKTVDSQKIDEIYAMCLEESNHGNN